MSLTLAIIKPDAVSSARAGKVLGHLEDKGFTIRAIRMITLS
ncbi:MAG: nucleoside-diphosphate kinase, partial [Longimicrobiales bacterium]